MAKTTPPESPGKHHDKLALDEKGLSTNLVRLVQGRDSCGFLQKAAYEICLRIAQGQTLREVCLLSHVPDVNTVLTWLYPPAKFASDPRLLNFQDDYARAKRQYNELLMDELVRDAANARDKDAAACAKVKLEAVKFRLERTEAAKYGPTSRIVRSDINADDDGGDAMATQIVKALDIIKQRRDKRESLSPVVTVKQEKQ